MDLVEKGMSQMGTSPKMPFRFVQSSQFPSEQSLMPEHQQDHPVPEDWTCYCVHVRVTLEKGEVISPTIPCMECLLFVDMFKEGIQEQITKAVVLPPREAVLSFGQQLHKEGLPLGSARDV